MKKPIYKNQSIGSIDSLAKSLSISLIELMDLSKKADKYYRPNKPEPKLNGGGIRQTYRVLPRLKRIQDRIKERIFYSVEFPAYLQGGIKDISNPRDYIKNADMHAGKRILIKEDIANFFPSIHASHVLIMWEKFFHFPHEVSKILTKLTTYCESVPQGASTSSYVANLIFWDKEPQLEESLTQKGFTYSRLVDDITVSSDVRISQKNQQFIVSSIYGMLFSKGLKPKRKKHSVQSSAKRMSMHGLNVNSLTPTMNHKEKQKIWASVKECESMATSNLENNEYKQIFNKIRGRVAVLARLHPREAQKYMGRLNTISPYRTSQK
jgi:hypothetical protein